MEMSSSLELFLDQCIAWVSTAGLDLSARILSAAIILVLGAIVIKIIASLLKRAVSKVQPERRLAVDFLVSVAIKLCWVLVLFIVLGKLGVNIGPLIAGLGVTGFILGFAFQESLASLASGLMLALNQPFKVGDHVTLAGFEGTILKLDMMAVVLVTEDKRRITIPNKNAWGSPIVNFSAQGRV